MTKYGRPDSGGTRIQHFGDVGVIHQRERLPFGLEPGDDTPGVHARLDDLQGDPPANRLFLFGHENDTTTALADWLQ